MMLSFFIISPGYLFMTLLNSQGDGHAHIIMPGNPNRPLFLPRRNTVCHVLAYLMMPGASLIFIIIILSSEKPLL